MDNACVRMMAGRVGGARTAESASKHGKCAVVAGDLISALILLLRPIMLILPPTGPQPALL